LEISGMKSNFFKLEIRTKDEAAKYLEFYARYISCILEISGMKSNFLLT